MTPGDVAGVFSRYFIVGFFAPTFFALTALKLSLSETLLPNAVQPDTAGAFLILGAAALLAALLLVGMNRPLQRLLEGYGFLLPYDGWAYELLRKIGSWLTTRQLKRKLKLKALLKKRGDCTSEDDKRRAKAASLLERQYPYYDDDLLPTRLGNALRAFERHGQRRWGINMIVVWPHIQSLLGEQESQRLEDGEANYAFFLNATVLSIGVGLIMAADAIFVTPHPTWLLWIYLVPFALTYPLYRGACTAAAEWGSGPRAALDLHRLDLYKKLGLRLPTTALEEKQLNKALTQTLLWGRPKDLDPYRAADTSQPQDEDQDTKESTSPSTPLL